MATLDYNLAIATGDNGATRVVTVRYNSVTLALLQVDVDNTGRDESHRTMMSGSSFDTPGRSHQVHDLSPLGLLMATVRGLLHPPAWSV